MTLQKLRHANLQRFGIAAAFRLAGLIWFGLAVVLLCRSLSFARADWLSRERTRPSILAAIQLFPDNSFFYRMWAEIEPRDALVASRQAAALNPMNPSVRIEVGVNAEKAGLLSEAEASFDKAVTLDRTFSPRSILADYYFRHRAVEKFWPTVRGALEHAIGDTTTLFEECWDLTSNAHVILEQAIPDRSQVLRNYLDFLVSHNHVEAAASVANRIMATNSPEGTDAMLNYCEKLVLNDSADNPSAQAVVVWNWLCKRRSLPYEVLEPQNGHILTNGMFTVAPISKGFDWRLSPSDGLYIELGKQGLDLTFTGNQPEKCEIASQFIPLEPNRRYRLRVGYSMSGIDRESGLSWRVTIPNGAGLFNGRLPGGGIGEQEIVGQFVAPPDAELGRLVLGYERVRGTVRIEGEAEIRRVELFFAE